MVREIRRIRPESTFVGVAGDCLQQAGCRPIDELTGQATMLFGAVKLAGRAWRRIRRVRRTLVAEPADLAILVDSPALHLPMAKQIKAAGCPILYYIAPQLWAWAPGRIRRLRRRTDGLAAILPFEEGYFRDRGVPVRYVGHPIVEQFQANPPDAEGVRANRGLGQPVVACLPGSRRHVVREVLPGQIEVARAIGARHRGAVFLFAAANPAAAEMIRTAVAGESFAHRIETGGNAEILAAADLALCASGTATLEVAVHRVPMVVMYNGSKWGYQLCGRWLIRTKHLCLVNILADKRIVPEFMPYYTSTEPIAAEALDLLDNPARREQTKADLDQVIESLGTQRAARGVAEMAIEIIERQRGCARPTVQ